MLVGNEVAETISYLWFNDFWFLLSFENTPTSWFCADPSGWSGCYQ